MPSDEPRPNWTQYGADPRSVASLTENLEAILNLAAGRRDRVVLMTFAVHVPQDYSLEAFQGKRLDYVLYRKPIEDWGRPQDVLKAVTAQNEVVRRLAARHPGALLVDQAALMDGTPRFFQRPLPSDRGRSQPVGCQHRVGRRRRSRAGRGTVGPPVTDHAPGSSWSPTRWHPTLLRLLAAGLLTCVVAGYNRFPITFPDSGNYLDNAIALAHGREPWFFLRPVTYGVFLVPFSRAQTLWLLPLAQGILAVGVLDLSRVLRGSPCPRDRSWHSSPGSPP